LLNEPNAWPYGDGFVQMYMYCSPICLQWKCENNTFSCFHK